MKLNKKRKLLKKVFKNKNYTELVKDIDIYMPNDTKIVRYILATKNVDFVMLFFYIGYLKSLIFNNNKKF